MAKATMGSLKRDPAAAEYERIQKKAKVEAGIAPKPTDEQKKCLALFATGKDMKIEAGAGAGKTSTLVMMARSTKRRGRYLAFNKALVTESEAKFPSNVIVSTIHSLAFQEMKLKYDRAKVSLWDRLKQPRMPMWTLAKELGLTQAVSYESFKGTRSVLIEARQMAFIVKAGVERFCQTGDPEITVKHLPWQKGLSFNGNDRLRKDLLPMAKKLWADNLNLRGTLPYGHHSYLKAYELTSPFIDADFILIDESQDLAGVFISVMKKQSTHGTQLVFVGDENQEVYAFTGAVNAMKLIKTKNVASLTTSFRFGQKIADVANDILDNIEGNTMQLKGWGNESTVGPIEQPRAILTRTNAAAVEALLTSGKKVHVVGGGEDVIRFCWAAGDLQEGKKTEHPDLACFANWNEVQEYVEQGGDDLKLIVTLIDRFGARRIAGALRNMPLEDEADIVYSTAHKSKGREWDTVQLASDFITTKRCTCEHTEKQHRGRGGEAVECYAGDCECQMFVSRGPTPEEMRLLYVAVTRAKLRLDLGVLTIGPDGIGSKVKEEEEL